MSDFRYRNRLFILRKAHQLSPDSVSERVGITKRTLQNYERCLNPIPSDKLIEFAKLYKCSTDYILYFKAERQDKEAEDEEDTLEDSSLCLE